jgi:hypothetical protein
MKDCPCCSTPMIRQIHDKQVYWFCRHCWEPMFVSDLNRWGSLSSGNLATQIELKKQTSSVLA